jgi:hypothetical protein
MAIRRAEVVIESLVVNDKVEWMGALALVVAQLDRRGHAFDADDGDMARGKSSSNASS